MPCRMVVVLKDAVGVKEADVVVVVAAAVVVGVEVADVVDAVVVVVGVNVADVVAAEVCHHCTAETGAVAVMLVVEQHHSYAVEPVVEVELHSFAVRLLMEEA